MSLSELNLDEKLGTYQRALNNALSNPHLRDKLAVLSYTHDRIIEGKIYLDDALDAHAHKTREYGEQYEATQELQDFWAIITKEIRTLRGVARVVFKDNTKAYTFLKLPASLKKGRKELTVQIQELLTNLENAPELIEALTPYSFDADRIAMIRERMSALPEYKNRQDKESSEAQQATIVRNEKIEILEEWMGDFIAIARIAVMDEPQLLELLGYTVEAEGLN